MEFLIQENSRLDRIYAQLLAGEIPVEPILVDEMWEDDNGPCSDPYAGGQEGLPREADHDRTDSQEIAQRS